MSYREELDKLKAKGQLNKGLKITGQEVQELLNEQSELREKVENLEGKASSLEKKVSELESDKAKLETEKKSLEDVVGDVNKELDGAKAQAAQYTEALKSAQDLISQREEEMNKLNQDLEEARGTLGENESKLSSLESLSGEVSAKEQTIAELQSKVGDAAALEEEVQNLREQVGQSMQLQNQVTQLNKTIEELQTELETRPSAQVMEEKEQELSSLSNKLEDLNGKIEDLQGQVAEKDARIKDLSEPQAVFQPDLVSRSQAGQRGPAPRAETPGGGAKAAMGPGRVSGSSAPARESPGGGAEMSTGSRHVCPNCGSTAIKEVEDRTRIVSYIPKPIYAKKMVCKKCSFEFT
ncbi:MAG TPA: hypothetical protein VKK79_17155 [Candidatus Lokiarchaeia archaeon]|nr:hypothetical protein [Candidatus Lokiarchaeia archaeon]